MSQIIHRYSPASEQPNDKKRLDSSEEKKSQQDGNKTKMKERKSRNSENVGQMGNSVIHSLFKDQPKVYSV